MSEQPAVTLPAAGAPHRRLGWRTALAGLVLSQLVAVACWGSGGGDPCLYHGGDHDNDLRCDDEDPCISSEPWSDRDNDGIEDACDPCPEGPNVDSDGDGVCDAADQCPGIDDGIDIDGDGTPDCVDPCLPPDCPAPGEVDNGDFEDGLIGWTYTPGSLVTPPEVVLDATGTGWVLQLAPATPGACGYSEAIGVMQVPLIPDGTIWSLRFRFRMSYDERYVPTDYEPSFQLRLDSEAASREFTAIHETDGWETIAFCVAPQFSGQRAVVSLRAALPDHSSCLWQDLGVWVDDIELVPDVADCVHEFP